MGDDEKTPCGRMHVAWQIDFFDREGFDNAVSRMADATERLSAAPHAIVHCRVSTGGRHPLAEADWAQRFQVVRRIETAKEGEGITLRQACAREGIPYSTFRDWRRKMRERGAK